jgi:predicted DNA-binding transcriptional regulator YafY
MAATSMEEIQRRMIGILILQVLHDYTDKEHGLTQQQILRRLKADYNAKCDRRTVVSNIAFLNAIGHRVDRDEHEKYHLTSRPFDDAELRVLVDSVLFSKSISEEQAKELIHKLERLGSIYFENKVSHVANLPELQHTDNRQVLRSIAVINDAIDDGVQIRFVYNRYGTDFRLHPSGRNPRDVTPYQMVAGNGRYYLICYDGFRDDLLYYRIDRMTDVARVEIAGKKLSEIPGMENGLDLPQHMAEHFYMFSGRSSSIFLRAKKESMGDLIDWFGRDFLILAQDEATVKVRVFCNENSIFYWALQYGQSVEVLAPADLRERIKNALLGMVQRYEKDPE